MCFVDREESPFLIVGMTLVSPETGVLRTPSQDSYTLLEATPLYIGEAIPKNISFPTTWYKGAHENITVGGLIETIAFGGLVPPVYGLGDNAYTNVLAVQKPEEQFTLLKWLVS